MNVLLARIPRRRWTFQVRKRAWVDRSVPADVSSLDPLRYGTLFNDEQWFDVKSKFWRKSAAKTNANLFARIAYGRGYVYDTRIVYLAADA